jgi:predicted transcriptional regulator
MPNKLEISNNIRKLRFFANEMTQAELAEKAGVSRQTIIAIEAGKYSPSLRRQDRRSLRLCGKRKVKPSGIYLISKPQQGYRT